MRKDFRFIIFFMTSLLFLGCVANAQEYDKCKVLMESISGVYNGDCKNGLAHGKGVAIGIDKYDGKFKNGLPNGKGKYSWANGDFYDGNWKAGKRSGEGIMFSFEQNVNVRGIWKNDEFVK